MKNRIDNIGKISIRRTRPSDKRTVLAFCKRTFGRWGDYLPEVWDEWVKDRKGIFFVAVLGKRPVGVGKITLQRPGEIWLEGLRVDPKFRGHKIGRVIQDWSWKWALGKRPRFIRYATGSYNKISQHLGKSMGMRLIAGFDEYSAVPRKIKETALVRSGTSELDVLLRLFKRDRDAANWKGLFLKGWSAWEFDREALAGMIAGRQVYSYYDEKGLAGALMILQSKDKKYLNYCRAAGRDAAAFKFILREGRALGRLLGARRMEMHLPKSLRNRRLVKGTGWRKAMPVWMVILEKRL
jgi:GNAT superfamily N-acetyltransferase